MGPYKASYNHTYNTSPGALQSQAHTVPARGPYKARCIQYQPGGLYKTRYIQYQPGGLTKPGTYSTSLGALQSQAHTVPARGPYKARCIQYQPGGLYKTRYIQYQPWGLTKSGTYSTSLGALQSQAHTVPALGPYKARDIQY